MIITVAGSFEKSVAPEWGVVQVRVAFEGDDADSTSRAAQEAVQELRSELVTMQAGEDSGLEDFTVEAPTSRCWHPYSHDGSPTAPRYAVEALATATFTDFQALSDACARWAATTGLSVADVRWELTPQHSRNLRDEVLTGAVRDAVERARVMARAAGADQVTVREIADPGLLQPSPGGDQSMPMMAMRAGAMGDGVGDGVELSPRDVVVASTVHVRVEA